MRTILAINGSERVGGNTSEVLRRLEPVLAERRVHLETVELAAVALARCGICGDCNMRPAPCGYSDDAKSIVARMVASDGIIYACPVHGFGTASLMQQFIERIGVGYLRFERPLTNKVAGVIVTGRRYSHMDVHAQLLHNVMLNRMILVGSGYPAVVHAGGRGEASFDHEGIDAVMRMVHRMVDMIDILGRHRELTGEHLSPPPGTERVPL